MVLALLNDELRAFPCGQDVLPKVYSIDGFPDLEGRVRCFFQAEVREAVKIGRRVLEYRLLKGKETVDVPLADVFFPRVDEDRKIEEV